MGFCLKNVEWNDWTMDWIISATPFFEKEAISIKKDMKIYHWMKFNILPQWL